MAEIEVNRLSLLELAKRTDPKGGKAKISENLAKTNNVLSDGTWVKANSLTQHVHTRQLALPTGTWRLVNQGVSEEAAQTKQITEGIGTLEAFSTVDQFLINLADDKAAFVSSEDMMFVEGLSQTFATTFIYGNIATHPEKFQGLAPRLNATGTYVLDGGSTSSTACTSVFFIQWGEMRCHFIYKPNLAQPTESHPVSHEDLGIETVLDGSNNPYRAHRSRFELSAGFCIHKDKNIGAIRNIATTGGANLFDQNLAIKLLNLLENRGEGTILYANRTVLAQVDILALDQHNHVFGPANLFGVEVTAFRGHPFRLAEAILDTEAAIS